ncbi:MAG: ABC transporter permease [Chloroflexi bacterium]|nr:ABC transporter permease [Chloroflexota bacterium]
MPVALRMERRLETPRWLPVLTTIGALVVALLISGLLIALIGGDPFLVFNHIIGSSFGGVGVLSDTLVKATPLIFTGLACALAFRMRLWNIGAEGQLYMGAWGASAVVLVPILPTDTTPFVLVPLMLVAGFAAGALWAGIAGWLKARFNVNEIITTLMLNYIAILWVRYWVFGPWSEGGFPLSTQFPRGVWLPRLTDFAKVNPDLGGLTVHLGFLLGVLCAFLMWFVLKRTRKGYEIRLVGDNPRAARYAGINIGRNIILVMLASGGLAGLAGMSEVTGSVHRLQDGVSSGYGFTGVIIAYLARFNPFGVVIASILFGALILAGREIQPAGIPAMIQGIVLFCVICSDILLRNRIRLVRR